MVARRRLAASRAASIRCTSRRSASAAAATSRSASSMRSARSLPRRLGAKHRVGRIERRRRYAQRWRRDTRRHSRWCGQPGIGSTSGAGLPMPARPARGRQRHGRQAPREREGVRRPPARARASSAVDVDPAMGMARAGAPSQRRFGDAGQRVAPPGRQRSSCRAACATADERALGTAAVRAVAGCRAPTLSARPSPTAPSRLTCGGSASRASSPAHSRPGVTTRSVVDHVEWRGGAARAAAGRPSGTRGRG